MNTYICWDDLVLLRRITRAWCEWWDAYTLYICKQTHILYYNDIQISLKLSFGICVVFISFLLLLFIHVYITIYICNSKGWFKYDVYICHRWNSHIQSMYSIIIIILALFFARIHLIQWIIYMKNSNSMQFLVHDVVLVLKLYYMQSHLLDVPVLLLCKRCWMSFIYWRFVKLNFAINHNNNNDKE